jgi:hypothetical protein
MIYNPILFLKLIPPQVVLLMLLQGLGKFGLFSPLPLMVPSIASIVSSTYAH